MTTNRKILVALVAAPLLLITFALVGLYAYAGAYGLNVIFRRGGSYWVAITPTDPRLSPAMRVALRDPAPQAQPGSVQWRAIDRGFEVAELAATVDGAEVDRILLARIDPALFKFEVHTRPSGKYAHGWLDDLNAALVVNGSYYGRYGEVDTPVMSGGVPMGPQTYQATHGAFVATKVSAAIDDLRQRDWRTSLAQADNAMVSYPLLLAPDGSSRVKADRRWLANRSFVAQDASGFIVIGTTRDAFFSLDALAGFLKRAPLNLAIALNLDGGPVACQEISLKGYQRAQCGNWETAVHDGQLKLLRWTLSSKQWVLPIALAVLPR